MTFMAYRCKISVMTLKEAHQQFVDNLKSRSRASATILAYGKDIDQLVKYLEVQGKTDPSEVILEDLQAFMAKLGKESYTAKSISRKTNSTFFNDTFNNAFLAFLSS